MTLINYLKKVSEFVIAETQYGKVSGIQKTSSINIPYVAFLGIPFATPPVGKLRFKVSRMTCVCLRFSTADKTMK